MHRVTARPQKGWVCNYPTSFPHGAGAQEGVKAKNRQICYSLSRALEKMSSKGPRMEAKGGQLQPNQQMNSVMKKSAQPSSDAVLHHSGGNRVPQAAPAAQKAVPALNTSKTQKTAVRARAGEALPGQSLGLSSMGTPQQPDSAKAKLKKLHAKPSQHPAGHASASGGASIPQTAPPPTLGGPEAGFGKTSQKSGRLRAQKEAAQLVNTDLNGQPGGSASSAPPMPSVQPAGNGVSAKKLERDRGQSLPNGRPAAVDVPQRAMMCAQKHTLAGEGGSPLRVTLQAAQGNGAASAGDGLTDSQRKKVCCLPASYVAALGLPDIPSRLSFKFMQPVVSSQPGPDSAALIAAEP